MYDLCYIFLLFMIYSILGYIAEITYSSIIERKFIFNRGFFLGPYLPIYGICSVVMKYLLQIYSNDILVLFIMSFFICTVIEFITSYILEKIFKVRWWDYSNKKLNIDGRVCIRNSTLFGLGGVILIKVINPIIEDIVIKLNYNGVIIISTILFVIFITDLVITIIALIKIKVSTNLYTKKDQTEEVKELIIKYLEKNSFLISHLLNAFPRIAGKNIEIIKDIHNKVKDIRIKIKNKSI